MIFILTVNLGFLFEKNLGFKQLRKDIAMMLGFKPNIFFTICFFITPVVTFVRIKYFI
jgi:hypothetical protein